MTIGGLPDGRFAPAVETAAYTVVAEVARAATGAVTVRADQADGALVVEVETGARRRARPRRARATGSARSTAAYGRPPGRPGAVPRGGPVRVVIADDETLLREGLERLLVEAGFEVVGKAGTADELMRRVALTRPDVAIVDIRMPPTHTDEGLVAAQQIRSTYERVGVLVLSHHVESRYAMRLLEEHPERSGYLLKERVSDLAVLVDALGRIDEGECVLDPTIVARLVGPAARGEPARRADAARARRPRADGRGALERRDLPRALPQPEDRGDARAPHPAQARNRRDR